MNSKNQTFGHMDDLDGNAADDDALFAKISWRLLPLLVVCYVIAFIDRVNIAFAQLGMKQTLPFNDAVYAAGAGIFFVGYLAFEVPSNLLLERIGVRKTLLRIMICWGLASVATAFVKTEMQLYTLRFLLGVFEAGFFPGVVLYLTYWYPPERRGRVFSIISIAIVVSPIISGPLSGFILKYCNGAMNLHGWQWLFIIQGLPACLLGIVTFYLLSDKPAHAKWLTNEQKRYLAKRLEDRQTNPGVSQGLAFRRLFTDPVCYLLAISSIFFSGASYSWVFSIPSLISSWGAKDAFSVGLYTIIPGLSALCGLLLIGRSSDRQGDRRWHFMIATSIAVAGMGIVVMGGGHLVLSLVGVCIVDFGRTALLPLYTTIVSNHIRRSAAAAGIALLMCVGHIGSAITPPIIAKINSVGGTPSIGLIVVACMYLCSGLLVMLALRDRGDSVRNNSPG